MRIVFKINLMKVGVVLSFFVVIGRRLSGTKVRHYLKEFDITKEEDKK